MKNLKKSDIVKLLLNQEINTENEDELLDMLIDQPIAIDVDKQDKMNIKFGDIIADKLTKIAGSWSFIIGFIIFLVSWTMLNVFVFKNVDPYPFILLNLLLSCLAALQAPIIMMSQNRAAKKDSLKSTNDYTSSLEEMMLTDYLDLQNTYLKLTTDQAKLTNYINDTLKDKSEVVLTSKVDTNTLSKVSRYFNFASY